MPSNKRKSESVEVFNLNMPEICDKLFAKTENPIRYEVKCYRFEIQGVSKTVCGESCFLEESKASITITYEVEKKDEFIALLQDRFPTCTYSFK